MPSMKARHAEIEMEGRRLAAAWFALAEASALPELTRALAVAKWRIEAARDVMREESERYAAFQAALVDGLSSARPRLRFECAHALDIFGDTSTRAPLTALMSDPVPRVRWMAMHALSCHACGEKPDALEAEVRARIGDAARLDPSPRVRRQAAVALSLADNSGRAVL
jgi:HEAT repeat protein